MTVTAPQVSPNSPPPAGNGPTSSVGELPFVLVPSRCFICNDDDAEPIAVGQDFDSSSTPDTFLAVRCRRCGLVYLNPAPAPPEVEANRLLSRDLGREIARFRRRLGDAARVLHVHGIEDLDHPREAYDAVLLINVLERVDDPLSTLKATRQLLQPGALALVVTPNTEATVSRIFRGRHWSGYNFPRHRNLFCANTLGQATKRAGLEIVSVRTVRAAEAWVWSVRNAMTDWRLPHWALAAIHRTRGAALLAGTAIESWHQSRGRGGLLLATLRRPTE